MVKTMITIAKKSKDIPPNQVEFLIHDKYGKPKQFTNMNHAMFYLKRLGYKQDDINNLLFVKV